MISKQLLGGAVVASASVLGPLGMATSGHAQSLTATEPATTTGTVVAEGDRVIGVRSLVWNGNNFTNGGHTTVSGVFSRGLYTLAMNGDNVTNTGTVLATGDFARAVMSVTFAGESCGANTVNVTGDVTATFHGLVLFGCGSSQANVLAGTSVISVGAEGIPVVNIASDIATTIVTGSVFARSSDSIAIDPRSESSLTAIQNNGFVFGTFDGTDGEDVFQIGAGGTWTTSGTSDFVAGNDIVTNAGTLNVAGPTTFNGLETFDQNGRVNLGAHSLTLSGFVFTNAGAINTSGPASILGVTAFNNSGTLGLGPGRFTVGVVPFSNSGTVFSINGSSNIFGQSSFTNSGAIGLQDGTPNDVLTIDSNFVGLGGSALFMDVAGASADRLVITGAALGSTVVNVANGGVFTFNQAGVLVVDNASSSSSSFVLGGAPDNALFNFRLEQRGVDFFLVTDPTALAFAPLAVGNLAQDMWYQGTDAYLSYAALKRGDKTRRRAVAPWIQLYASNNRYGGYETATVNGVDFDFNNGLKANRHGVQAGVDLRGPQISFGATGGYQKTNSDGGVTDFDAQGYNLGVYGSFGDETGFYGNLLLKKDWIDVRMQNSVFNKQRPDVQAVGVDGQIGYRFATTNTTIDLEAGLSHVGFKTDDFAASGVTYDYKRMTSTRGRLGGRLGFGNLFGAYVDAKLLHEFSGETDLRLGDASDTFEVGARGRGTWGRVEVGVGGNKVPGPQLAGWTEFGDVKGIGIRGGFRF